MSRASNEFRLFVSSTFTDLQPEREQLVKKTFPRLRAKCRERGVEFTEIDLRWGISDEESRAGQTIRICLEEIDRCRPYFIGILGSRYGWVPSITEIEKDPEILAEFPWLREYGEAGKSIIEMEFAHGAIRNKNDSAFFYEQNKNPLLKKERATDDRSSVGGGSLGDEKAANPGTTPQPPSFDKLRTGSTPLRSAGGGAGEARGGVDELDDLKSTLQSTISNYRRFASPEELGEQVYRDLLAILDRDWPVANEPSPLELARAAHRAFAMNRRRSYVADPEYLAAFEEFVDGTEPALVVWGRSGFGKSALIAYLAEEYAKKNPDAFVISYFVGSASEGSDHFDLMRHVMAEIKARYDLADELPASDDSVREEFPVWLAKAVDSGKRIVDSEKTESKNTGKLDEIMESLSTIHSPLSTAPLILFLDAVNQLSGIGPEMHWLPEFIPPNVRLVISTTPADDRSSAQPLEELRKRAWQELEMQPLSAPQRARIADGFLGRYRKSLPEDALANIAASPRTESPLFLRTLLEELRVFGRHSTLNAYLENYLVSKDERDLFDKVLARLEHDHGEATVRAVMTAIWGARHGLSETELIEITGVTRMALSTLLIAMEYHLMQREGLYTFFHNYLREGVELRYVPNNVDRNAAHELLATYFFTREYSVRRREEEAWQWRAANNIDALWRCLVDPEMFMLFANDDERYHFIAYLQSFERERTQELFRALHEAMRADATFDRRLELAQTARIAGYYDAATEILTAISEQATTMELDYKTSLQLKREWAQLYGLKQEYRLALPKCEEVVELIESKEGKSEELFNAMIDLSTVMHGAGDYAGAESVIRRALEFGEETMAAKRLDAMQNLASFIRAQGRLSEAIILWQDVLESSRKVFGVKHPSTLAYATNLAAGLIFERRFNEALKILEYTLPSIKGVLGDKHEWYLASLGSLGRVYKSLKNFDSALQVYSEMIEKSILVNGPESEKTVKIQLGIGHIYFEMGEIDTAFDIYILYLPLLAKVLGTEHPIYMRSMNTLNRIAEKRNQTN